MNCTELYTRECRQDLNQFLVGLMITVSYVLLVITILILCHHWFTRRKYNTPPDIEDAIDMEETHGDSGLGGDVSHSPIDEWLTPPRDEDGKLQPIRE